MQNIVKEQENSLSNFVNDSFNENTSEVLSLKLKDQINGSSGSVIDNIAEGFESNSRNEFVQFLSFSKGSSGEVKSQLYRALDRKYISQEIFEHLYKKADEIGNKTGVFIKYLNSSEFRGTKFKNRN